MNFSIQQNFARIYRTIAEQGIKRTAFAKAMGYSSTSQLSATLEGDALISTKAVIELIKNFNVSPNYLFTGQGPMFLSGKDEVSQLQEQIRNLEQNKNELLKKTIELAEMVKILEKRNGDLIDITAMALKNYKEEEEKRNKQENIKTE